MAGGDDLGGRTAGTVILDPATLNANTMSDRSLQAELFDLYFDQTPSLMATLDAAVVTGDAGAWRGAAHGMKGTARTLGLLILGDATAVAEHSAPAARHVERIAAALEAAKAAAAAYLDETDASAA